MRKTCILIMIGLLLSFICPHMIYAEEIISEEHGVDITFVVDYSGSMKTNDPSGIGKGMVKAFIDTAHIENIRIGYVAYNDKIISSASPVSISDQSEREKLKDLIDSTSYYGDTDIGLALSYSHSLMPVVEGRKRVMVLISDGGSDLSIGSERTLEESQAELYQVVEQCANEEIPIYTIAFGAYEGSKAILEKIAADTEAASYSAQNPETLIEVLYGIFQNNLSYKIQQLSSGIYSGGEQEIRCVLDENYLDEMDVLLISSGAVGETVLKYGEKHIEMTRQSNYSVGKISANELDSSVRELVVNTTTSEGQSLKIFIISYRKIVPILHVDQEVQRNQTVTYQVYFKDKNGEVIHDEEFYKQFHWELANKKSQNYEQVIHQEEPSIESGVLQGAFKINRSGNYQFQGNLSDHLGVYRFDVMIEVTNTPPHGSLPLTKMDVLKSTASYDLNTYFKDTDQDQLIYSFEKGVDTVAEVEIQENQLLINAKQAGVQNVTIFVSDGEETLAYPFQITVVPFWQAYWWIILIILAIIVCVCWKLFYKPKPLLQQIAEKKAGNRFTGKLNAYVTRQPEGTEEIPPLTFSMYKIRDSKVCLGDLMKDYPELSEKLELNQIFLIADEERKMILYHATSLTVMLGGMIVCRRLQYNVSFGDILYITSEDEGYEIEVHYISVIQ